MISEISINFAGEQLTLNQYRSIFWDKEKSLILSDLHLGKTAHFRKNGIALPNGVIEKDLENLQKIIEHYGPEKIIIVGDLFHAELNSEIEIFRKWFESFNMIKWLLVKGNHDRFSKKFGIEEAQIYETETLIFSHEALDSLQKPQIGGHIHPGVTLMAQNRQKLKFPCFLVSENQIILPAFSQFTGLDTNFEKKQNSTFKKYIITAEKLIEW